MKARFLLMALIVVCLGSPVQADVSRLTKLTALGREAASVPDARAFTALRRLWAEWDRGDPTEVEEEIAAVARATRGSRRVYAELLAAYGRRRRGDLDGARAQIVALGFVSKWLVAGSFDNEGKAGLARPFGRLRKSPGNKFDLSVEFCGNPMDRPDKSARSAADHSHA